MAEHSPLPWKVDMTHRGDQIFVDADGEELGYLYTNDGADEPTWLPVEANAAFIVRACNSHAALVEALTKALELLERNGIDRPDIRAALEEATAIV